MEAFEQLLRFFWKICSYFEDDENVLYHCNLYFLVAIEDSSDIS